MPTPDASAQFDYPLPAFHFRVIFSNLHGSDTSFQEVRGITSEMETEDVPEGGENHFVHRLPKAVKHPLLELKRGLGLAPSPLITWCRGTLESGFARQIRPSLVNVYLLDSQGDPLRGWAFANAYPVKWEIDDFNSTKNDVAIESISLSYSTCTPISLSSSWQSRSAS